MTRVAIAGIGGRMGCNVAALIHEDAELTLAGGVIRPASVVTLDSVREAINDPEWSGRIVDDPADILTEIDVLVDFTNPEGSMRQARACCSAGVPMVSGTTGLSSDQFAELRRMADQIPVFHAANLSIGVTTILELLPGLARSLPDYDIEIVETHHAGKADSPSGTALRIAESLRAARRDRGETAFVHGRQGEDRRQPGEIGIHAVRAGGNTGEHTVIFASGDEQLEITHRSYSRLAYTRGAVTAVKFITGKQSGFYTAADLVG